MLFHYALVDDLISKEEFERRVETKIGECGDLVDEPTAAMLVVGELGRQHVKIRGLAGKSSLFSFFGKVIDKTEPREFDRKDGEKGWVATLLAGDRDRNNPYSPVGRESRGSSGYRSRGCSGDYRTPSPPIVQMRFMHWPCARQAVRSPVPCRHRVLAEKAFQQIPLILMPS